MAAPSKMTKQVQAFFAAQGPLAKLFRNYEVRPGQQHLAVAIAEALSQGQSCLAEAGTGTGKTLAYLVPAALSGKRIVVSTSTKTLQDQLLHTDVPLLEKALGHKLGVEVLKGRNNYICHYKAEPLLLPRQLALSPASQSHEQLQQWYQQTATGDRAQCHALQDGDPYWHMLSSTAEQCLGRSCASFERCFVTEARRRAHAANLIIVNHHLYIADAILRQTLGEEGRAILPAHDAVIFDEAHDMEEVLAQQLGFTIHRGSITGLLQEIEHQVQQMGLLATSVAQLRQPLLQSFHSLVLAFNLPSGKHRWLLAHSTEQLTSAYQVCQQHLAHLERLLHVPDNEPLAALRRRLQQIQEQLSCFFSAEPKVSLPCWQNSALPQPWSDTHTVRLVEIGEQPKLTLRPLDIAKGFTALLPNTLTLFLSATLQVGQSFAHIKQRLGIEQAAEVVVASPFDYHKQAVLYLPTDLPEPTELHFWPAAGERAARLVEQAGGGALLLCTSYRGMLAMQQALQNWQLGPLLVQGEQPKAVLIKQLKQSQHAVLIATLSFWQGVDIPGFALRLVIMDKLPFASPGDPWLEARLQQYKQQGQDPFLHWQIPQAALLLRQGFGRLIRTQQDAGVVAILDKRIQQRRYGRLLRQNLPACQQLEDWQQVAPILASHHRLALKAAGKSPPLPKHAAAMELN